jgi:hypothetical protein
MTQRVATLAQRQPLWADLAGGMDHVADLKTHTTRCVCVWVWVSYVMALMDAFILY